MKANSHKVGNISEDIPASDRPVDIGFLRCLHSRDIDKAETRPGATSDAAARSMGAETFRDRSHTAAHEQLLAVIQAEGQWL